MPDQISFPLFIAPFLAALGNVDFSLHLVGQTGTFKTELAALIQQFFGKDLNARNIPAYWSSTANSLEIIAFIAKDAALVIDDFSPNGTSYQIAKAHADADRIFRAQGNRSGRQRLKADGSMRSAKPPRGMIVSTGEDTPRGHSVRARVLVLEIGEGAVNKSILTNCQNAAANGIYSSVLSAYIQWVAPQRDELLAKHKIRAAKIRGKLEDDGGHARLPFNFSQMIIALETFLIFTQDVDALSRDDAVKLLTRGKIALWKICEAQSQHHSTEEPAHRFLRLVGALITSGRAHLASIAGDEPINADSYGWQFVTLGTGDYQREEWRPKGRCIGWVDGADLFLEPDSAFAEVQIFANSQGEVIPLTQATLRKRLKDQSLLTQIDEKRGRLTIRKTIAGKQRNVIAIRSDAIF